MPHTGPASYDDLNDPEGVDAWEAMKRRAPEMTPEDHTRLQAFVDTLHKPLGSGDPRRHHFIPEFYQRRFANDDGQIAVIPIHNHGHRIAHVSKVAVMKDLYTVVADDIGETAAIERLLAAADGQAADVITRMLGGSFPPSREDRDALAMWLALLHVRDPYTRRTMEALTDSGYKLDLSLAADPQAARARLCENLGREPSEEEVAELVDAARNPDSFEVVMPQTGLIGEMLDLALMGYAHFLRRQYAIVKFPTAGLTLCDKPLVLYQRPANRSLYRGVGIINADELWLPLDRSTALVLHKEPDIGEPVIDALLHHDVDEFNQAVVLNAAFELYCHPDDIDRVSALERPAPHRPLMTMTGGDWLGGSTDGINEPPQRQRHYRYRRQ